MVVKCFITQSPIHTRNKQTLRNYGRKRLVSHYLNATIIFYKCVKKIVNRIGSRGRFVEHLGPTYVATTKCDRNNIFEFEVGLLNI
jgi:hypothetical protein